MSLYSMFYNSVISRVPERIVEFIGGPYTKMNSWIAPKFIQLPVEIEGVKFANPIGMSSGWADTPSKIASIHRLGGGVVVAKTITFEERKGNNRPRLVRGDQQLINSMGLPNKGLEWWENKLTEHSIHPTILSIRGETEKEWVGLLEKLENSTDIFELNFSCPNLHDGVMDLVTSRKIVENISSVTNKKIWLKLSPEYSPLQNLEFVNSVRDKISGITAINTVPVDHKRLGNPQHRGGLSGPVIYPTLVENLKSLRREYPNASDLPIFAVGGIDTAEKAWGIFEDFQAFPLALTAFLMRGPFFFGDVARYFKKRLEISEYSTLQSMID